jgi:hypothetical protein
MREAAIVSAAAIPRLTAMDPSTTLRAVPLPICDGEDLEVAAPHTPASRSSASPLTRRMIQSSRVAAPIES